MTDTNNKGIGFYSRIIHLSLERTINAYLKERELTKVQMDVMRFVENCHKKGYSVKQRDIEDYFHISNPTVSGILDRLEQKDLITRIKSKEDRRVRFIELTENGKEMMESLSQTIANAEEEMLEGVTPKLRKDGMEFLKKVFENATRGHEREIDQ